MTHLRSSRQRHPAGLTARPRQRGFAIIEALIALLIFSIGALGLIGLQVSLMRATSGAKYRAEAAFLASDLLGTMWADARNLGSYTTANCAGYTKCNDWDGKVAATLPGGDSTLDVNSATGLVSVKITWTLPKEGAHSYVTSASINP